ncbi:MAG TPA: tetratricopeptide repeat protein [Bacteroidia bacterium]
MKSVILCLVSIFICSTAFAAKKPESKPKSLSAILNDSAVAILKKGDTKEAFALVDKAIEQAIKDNENVEHAKAINNKGLIYLKSGDPKVALLYFEQSLDLLKKLKLKPKIATAMLNLGISYKEMSNYDKALKYVFESIETFIELKDTVQLGAAYNTIGNIFNEMSDYKQSLFYHNQSLHLRSLINSEYISGSLLNIGSVYKNMGLYDSALFYFNRSLKLKTQSNKNNNVSNTLSKIGEVYELKGDYNSAYKYLNESQKLRIEAKDLTGMARSDYEFGKLYFKFSKYPQATVSLQKCIKQSHEFGQIKLLAESYEMLKLIFEKKGLYKEALHYADQFKYYKDSLMNKEKQKMFLDMQVKYELEGKEREISELNNQREKNDALMQNQTLQIRINENSNRFLIIALILVLSVVVLMLILFRNNKKFTYKLDMVLRDLHHRVKNNFQVLYALNNLQKNLVEEPKAKAILATNNDRIAAMMLIHKELYMDRDMTSVTLPDYIRTLVNNLLSIYEKEHENIQFQYNLQSDIKLDADKAIVFGLLVNELVTNSLKHAFNSSIDSPTIRLDLYSPEPGKYRFIYSDNGQGLSSKEDKKTLGMNLIDNQIKLLKGSVVLQTQTGLKYDISF